MVSIGKFPFRLEGDFSTYSIYDSFLDNDIYNMERNQYAIFDHDETIILLVCVANLVLNKYVIATKAFSELTTNLGGYIATAIYGEPQMSTVRHKYVVLPRKDATGFFLFKNGILLKEFRETDIGCNAGTVYSASISPKGKYIIVSCRITEFDDYGWVLFKGA